MTFQVSILPEKTDCFEQNFNWRIFALKCCVSFYNETSPYTGQNDHHPKSTNNKYWRGCGEKGNLLHILVGMEIDTATVEDSMKIP